MAEAKKKTENTTKKTTASKTKKNKKEEITTTQKTSNIVEDVKKQIEAVNTEINIESDNIEKIAEDIKNELEPINEVIEEGAKIDEKQKELETLMSKEPNKVDEFVKKEIENTEYLKDKIQKIISSSGKKISNKGFTGWWNGSNVNF